MTIIYSLRSLHFLRLKKNYVNFDVFNFDTFISHAQKNNFQLYQMCSEHYNPATWNKNRFQRKQILSFTKWEQIHY